MEPWAVLGGAALGGIGSVYNNERNLAFQKDAQEWNKRAQEKTWEREDNAVQRRVADMTAAGLHRTLAAGNAAQAGSLTKIDPMNSSDAMGAEGAIAGMNRGAQTQQSIAATEAARSVAEMNRANVVKIGAEAAKSASMNQVIRKEWGLDQGKSPFLHPKFGDQWIKRLDKFANIFAESRRGRKPNAKSQGKDVHRQGMIDTTPGQLVPELNFGGIFD
jgi:hypothetical protein